MATEFHYATEDPKLVAAYKAHLERRKAWDARVDAIATREGREAAIMRGYSGSRFTHFALKKGESPQAAAWKGTQWALEKGFLRPRATTAKGKALLAEMGAVGTLCHPAEGLRGIPKMFGFLGRPGLFLSPDGLRLVVSYAEAVKYDTRWRPLKQSEYWTLREATEAAPREA